MTWLRLTIGALLALLIMSVVIERHRRSDRTLLQKLQPKCIRDARAGGVRF